jgi:hypothetical protein
VDDGVPADEIVKRQIIKSHGFTSLNVHVSCWQGVPDDRVCLLLFCRARLSSRNLLTFLHMRNKVRVIVDLYHTCADSDAQPYPN